MTVKKRDILWLLSPFLVALYPCLYMYLNNFEEAVFTDMFRILIIFVIIVLFMFFLYYAVIRNFIKSTLMTSITTFLLLNFTLFEQLLSHIYNDFYYWHNLLIAILFVYIVFIMIQYISLKEIKKINKLISFIYIILIAIIFIQSIPKIYTYIVNSKQIITVDNQYVTNTKDKKNPNFYYIIFDEYGGFHSLKHYFNYDNKEFEAFLLKNKFNIGYDSYSKYYFTIKTIPDLLNLNYVVKDNTTHKQGKDLLINPFMYTKVKSMNYKLNIVSSVPFLDISTADYNFVGRDRVNTGTMFYYLIEKTVFYPLLLRDSDRISIMAEDIKQAINYISKSYKIQDSNLCTIAYFPIPHNPYLFQKDGSLNSKANITNVKDRKYFIEQLQYTNVLIMDMIQSILKNDPNCIILIQADHGARPLIHMFNLYRTPYPPKEEEPYMRNILNILYYKGEKIDIRNLSGVDTLKHTVNMIEMEK